MERTASHCCRLNWVTSEPNLRARPNKPGDLQLAPVGHFSLLSVTLRKAIWDERGFVLFCWFWRVAGSHSIIDHPVVWGPRKQNTMTGSAWPKMFTSRLGSGKEKEEELGPTMSCSSWVRDLPLGSIFLLIKKKFFKINLLFVYECFAWVYVYVPCVCLALTEVRTGH